jgi:hypothetical protein
MHLERTSEASFTVPSGDEAWEAMQHVLSMKGMVSCQPTADVAIRVQNTS